MPVIVNNVEITDDEVHEEMQHHPAPSVNKARDLAAQALIIRELLFQEAVRLELTDSKSTAEASEEKISTAIDKLIEEKASIPEADTAACERYYSQHKESFKDQKTGEVLPFNLVEKHIQNYLHDKAMRIAVQLYVENLANSSQIAGFNLVPGAI